MSHQTTVKTYPHDAQQSGKLGDEHRAAAALIAKTNSMRWFAEYNLLHLQHVGEYGLPNCYVSAEDFLYDFWPDLPWDLRGQRAVARLMLSDPRFPAIRDAVQASIGHDMRVELEQVFE